MEPEPQNRARLEIRTSALKWLPCINNKPHPRNIIVKKCPAGKLLLISTPAHDILVQLTKFVYIYIYSKSCD